MTRLNQKSMVVTHGMNESCKLIVTNLANELIRWLVTTTMIDEKNEPYKAN